MRRHLFPLIQGKSTGLGGVGANGYEDIVEKPRSPFYNVYVPEGDRITRKCIDNLCHVVSSLGNFKLNLDVSCFQKTSLGVPSPYM
jgi:hypothetical protein